MRNYGSIEHDSETDRFIVTCEAHVMMRLKGLFPRVNKAQMRSVYLTNVPRTCHELLWFMDLFPLECSLTVTRLLRAGRRQNAATKEMSFQLLTGAIEPRKFELSLTPRPYQAIGTELALRRRACLIADEMGIGKTLQGLALFTQRESLPALCVMKVGLLPQWEREAIRCLPGCRVHVIREGPGNPLPPADIYMIAYTRIESWSEFLAPIVKCLVIDEIHELRHRKTGKYAGCCHVSRSVEAAGGVRIGLSGTPIANSGEEMFSSLDLLEEGCLGGHDEFEREWCGFKDGKLLVNDPDSLGRFLMEEGLMLRRTRLDVGIQMPPRTRVIEMIETSEDAIAGDKSSAIELARRILTATKFTEIGQAAREFDMRMRQSTGIAKAPGVAAYARMLLEQGTPVIIFAWHREVYSVLHHHLGEFNPVMFTGSETPPQKEASLNAFKSGETKLLFMSLGAVEGQDGLQDVCATVIFAELALTALAHEQGITRVDRPGQKLPTLEIYCITENGSDPAVSRIIGVKRDQSDGILRPFGRINEVLTEESRVKEMAREFLAKQGIRIEKPAALNPEEEDGQLGLAV